MNATRFRYRGAQPFVDDIPSQRTFFGRRKATQALLDQILANRLVVVYAKSGLGKSSLLNAGVAPNLRNAHCQPLMVRLNDPRRNLLDSLVDTIKYEAFRQHVEYVPGRSSSLWEFFKTVEFWRGDLLLTPVLILDQFEELFTLHDEVAQETFLYELGCLVRGTPPVSWEDTGEKLTAAPPSVHVVISLREDFLGSLEMVADHMPQILENRFRLTPLNKADAKEAMIEPARLRDPIFIVKPFNLDEKFTDTLLDFLSLQAARNLHTKREEVEPFYLQLICQRIEQNMAARKYEGNEQLFGMSDFGGLSTAFEVMRDFYVNAIKSVESAYMRASARRLCENFLISPEGRRLSLDEYEIKRDLQLTDTALSQLVQSRLLRIDRRSDSSYYELSHDALIEPVLSTRRARANMVAWAFIAFASMLLGAGGAFLIGAMYSLIGPEQNSWNDFAFIFINLIVIAGMAISWYIFKSGLRTYHRFKKNNRIGKLILYDTRVSLYRRHASTMLSFVATLATMSILVYGSDKLFDISVYLINEYAAKWIDIKKHAHVPIIRTYPVVELIWSLISSTSIAVLGLFIWEKTCKEPFSMPPIALPRFGRLNMRYWCMYFILGPVAFLFAMLMTYLAFTCYLPETTPDWVFEKWVPMDVQHGCVGMNSHIWVYQELLVILFIVSMFFISIYAWRAIYLLRRKHGQSFQKTT